MLAANVIQLRQMLSEKFPGLRQQLAEPAVVENVQPAYLPQIDAALHGGFPRGALTEIVSAGPSAGSALLLRELLARAAAQNQIVTLIDGADSLDVAEIDEAALSRLLWLRCRSLKEALKAADLVLRDRNLPLVLIDLKVISPRQLQQVQAATWYRFQRLIEETATVCVVFTTRPVVTPAQARITLHSKFSIAELDLDKHQLLTGLKMQIDHVHQFSRAEIRQRIA